MGQKASTGIKRVGFDRCSGLGSTSTVSGGRITNGVIEEASFHNDRRQLDGQGWNSSKQKRKIACVGNVGHSKDKLSPATTSETTGRESGQREVDSSTMQYTPLSFEPCSLLVETSKRSRKDAEVTQTIDQISSPLLTHEDTTQTPTDGRQRSSVKTNPCLPWLRPRHSYGSTTSSGSADSGYGLNDTNACNTTSPNFSSTNFRDSTVAANGDRSLEHGHYYFYLDSNSPEGLHFNGMPQLHSRERTQIVLVDDEDCISSDDVISTASSSAFSSRESSVSCESDTEWSAGSRPSAASAYSSSGALADVESSLCSSNASLLTINPSPGSHRTAASSYEVRNKAPRNFAQINNCHFMPVSSKYTTATKMGRNEGWVGTTTETLCSDEDDNHYSRLRDCLQGQRRYTSKPIDQTYSSCATSLTTSKVLGHERAVRTPLPLALVGSLSPRLCHELNDVPSPAPIDWSVEKYSVKYSSLDCNEREMMDCIFGTSLCSSFMSDGQFSSPITPSAVDSGIGTSDGMDSSTSSTPTSTDICQLRVGKENKSQPQLIESSNEIEVLSEKIRQLRFELYSIDMYCSSA